VEDNQKGNRGTLCCPQNVKIQRHAMSISKETRPHIEQSGGCQKAVPVETPPSHE
jgi:hypothetical protein